MGAGQLNGQSQATAAPDGDWRRISTGSSFALPWNPEAAVAGLDVKFADSLKPPYVVRERPGEGSSGRCVRLGTPVGRRWLLEIRPHAPDHPQGAVRGRIAGIPRTQSR